MHKQIRYSIAVLAIALATVALSNVGLAEDKDGKWISIFDGKTLEGWRANSENPQSFKVEDGVLIVDGPRGHLFYNGPVGGADFKDFEVKMDVKTFPNANSGVFFHTQYQDTGWPNVGYEAQVNATHSDRIKTGSIYAVKNVMDNAPHKDGEWFNYHIIVKGKKVTIKVNDKVVNEFDEPADAKAPKHLSSGTIAIQAHDPQSVIHYKNIQVKLPE